MINKIPENTKRKIFTLHTSKMSLNDDVDLDEFINQKDDLSGADIKAICSEAGLMALRERRMRVQMADFRAARERVMVSWLQSRILLSVQCSHRYRKLNRRDFHTSFTSD